MSVTSNRRWSVGAAGREDLEVKPIDSRDKTERGEKERMRDRKVEGERGGLAPVVC